MEIQTAACQDSLRPFQRLFLAGLLALALLAMTSARHAHATNLSAACPDGIATPCLASLTTPAPVTMDSNNRATVNLQLTIIGANDGDIYGVANPTSRNVPSWFQVDWGDGSAPTNLVHTVNNQSTCGATATACDSFAVVPSHTYTQAGNKTISVLFPDQNNTASIQVNPAPGALQRFDVTWPTSTDTELCNPAKPYSLSWTITDTTGATSWQVTVTWKDLTTGAVIDQVSIPSGAQGSLSHDICGTGNNQLLVGAPAQPSLDVLFAGTTGHKSQQGPYVTLVDTTSPTLPDSVTAPATSSSGATVMVYATDYVWGSLLAKCTPSTAAIGSSSVSCSATDGSSNSATGLVGVTVTDTPVINVPPSATIPATSGSGAPYAAYAALPPATNFGDGPLIPVCGPLVPGSTFPIGETTVTCTATGTNGSATASFTVSVHDLPVITGVPSNATIEASGPSGAPFTYALPTATELARGTPVQNVSCLPASGTTFPIASPGPATTVTCTATDVLGNTGTASFTVTVKDTTAPEFTRPLASTSLTTTSASGTTVTWSPITATDLVDGTITAVCSPASGTIFPAGTTPVACTATDSHGHPATATFSVIVTLVAPPTVNVPSNITVTAPAGATTAVVTYTPPTATDSASNSLTPTCSSAPTTGLSSGSSFPLGITTITCSATDSAGNTGTALFTVTVVAAAPTVLTTAEACKHGGWKNFPDLGFRNQGDCVSYVGTHGKNPPVGDHHDDSSNSDHKPPRLDLPDDITVHTTDEHGARVTYTVSATDDSGGQPAVRCTVPSGSLFEVGKTTVKCSAADASGNAAVDTFDVTVVLDHPKKDDAKDGNGEHGDHHEDDHH